MAVSIASKSALAQNGLRPLDVRRDMRGVATLIGEVFANELDRAGLASLRELRTISRLGPLLYLLVPGNGELNGFFQGFVWEEGGEIVGNVTLQQLDDLGRRWMIANVAVAPSLRRRGIARALMDAALERIWQAGGEWALLQVREHNDVARSLYERMGFSKIMTETALRCQRPPATPPVSLPADVEIERLYDRDWPAVQYLLSQALPGLPRWWNPIRSKNFRRNSDPALVLRWGHRLGLPQRQRLGLRRGSDLLGVLDVWANPRDEQRLDILLHPDVREAWTEPVLHYGLRELQRYPQQPISATLFDYQPQAIVSLQALDFRPTRVLVTMRKRLA